MTTLIIGASGQLGTAFSKLLPMAIAWDRRDLDLREIGEIRSRVEALSPRRIINCAAYTDVEGAEDHEATATAVNGEAVGVLAAVASGIGAQLVTFSTDYVFDGLSDEPYTESSVPNPLNAYGRSKLMGEDLALTYPKSLVVRTSWLLSTTHPNFVTTVLSLARERETLVVDDQWGRPTMVDDLAPATLQALDSDVTGLLHLASPPTTTRHGLAQDACRAAGVDPGRIIACTTADYPTRAPRPRHAALATERIGFSMPDWRNGLARVADNR